jgi:hypothetical protein
MSLDIHIMCGSFVYETWLEVKFSTRALDNKNGAVCTAPFVS